MGVITQTFSESKSITYLKAFCKVTNEQMPSLGIGETALASGFPLGKAPLLSESLPSSRLLALGGGNSALLMVL